jgi:acyl dehydratase
MSEEHGRITDEGIAKLRARIGKGFPGRRPWRTEVTRDAIYHLALAIGDLNPLYLDDEYARKTRWGTLLAPPIIVQSMDTLRAVGHSGLPEGLPGVHSIWTGSLYEWERPVKLGDRLRADCYL